jgi:hypothetical protein
MADYGAFPLWAVPAEDPVSADDVWAGGLVPGDLPLSPSLIAELQAWAEKHDRLLGPTFEWPTEQAKIAFVADGRQLVARVRDELSSDYEVVYFDEITGSAEDE